MFYLTYLLFFRVGSSVDAALVDAPCSSSGVLRRRPSLRWDMDPAAARHDDQSAAEPLRESLPALQRALLVRAATAVKPGGRLVYATCSVLFYKKDIIVTRTWLDLIGRFQSNFWGCRCSPPRTKT